MTEMSELEKSYEAEKRRAFGGAGGPGLWIIVAVVIGLNIWFDIYHPLGLIFDAVIVVAGLYHYLVRA